MAQPDPAETARLFPALLEAVERGELEAPPGAKALLRRIEGAALTLEALANTTRKAPDETDAEGTDLS
jgi:hypothetical protein